VRYRIVDVFSDRPLAGNQLCVVLDECPETLLQAVAREVNLSETTFPTVTGPGSYRNRIFTPSAELAFAGHPSLGTAWVLGPGRWEQTTSGAVVTVEVDDRRAVMSQPDPTFVDVETDGIAAAIGVAGTTAAAVATVAGNAFLIAATSDELAEAAPDQGAIAAICRRHAAMGLGTVRRIDDRNLHVRVFVPLAGIPEDPGTGAMAGPFALFARDRLGTGVDVAIRQGDEIGRPCRIEAHAEEGAITVGGAVTACAEGRFVLDA
jgi:trans-2,3-dihydro-3-hydroxyanthranilate isomerase